jgi:hypothetical protein
VIDDTLPPDYRDWDDWGYDPDDDDDYEPDWSTFDEELPPIGRKLRAARRRWQHRRRTWRKPARHHNDRFWQARNRPAFDEKAPF